MFTSYSGLKTSKNTYTWKCYREQDYADLGFLCSEKQIYFMFNFLFYYKNQNQFI